MPKKTTGSDPDEDISALYPAYVSDVAALLIILRRLTGGDLDKALIMAVIGDRHLEQRRSDEPLTRANLGQSAIEGRPSVNAYSIAQYAGIPRETVRRKVAALIREGWVSKDAGGNLMATAKAANDLAEGTDAAFRLLDRIGSLPRG